MPIKRKTKIVATIGPAICNYEKISELIQSGVNVFRLNFSHGDHEQHLNSLKLIRKAETNLGITTAVLQDLSGPKVRITELEEGCEEIKKDEELEIKQGKDILSNNKVVYTALVNPCTFVKEGDTILLADGNIELIAKTITNDSVVCTIKKDGKLRSRIGLAFPDSNIDLPATTEKDLIDFEWGLENEVDFVAVSFVQKADDIKLLKDKMGDTKTPPFIISKIEMSTALKNLDEIIEVSDGIMVARGDLGVEIPVEKLPAVQSNIIKKSNAAGKPVIVATQMLHSMVNATRPTRAEVTDVANAVNNGADAVMLSEETAIGAFPRESVEYLAKIAHEAEKDFDFEVYKLRFGGQNVIGTSVPNAIAYAACAAAHNIGASTIVACTETGFSAKLIAKYRPQATLFGISRNIRALRRMCLYWGVSSILTEKTSNSNTEVDNALELIKQKENLDDNQIAITTGGIKAHHAGTTSVLDIRTFGNS